MQSLNSFCAVSRKVRTVKKETLFVSVLLLQI